MIRLLMLLAAFAVSPRILGVEPEPPIPDALKPWIPWVLAEDDRRDCPLIIGIGGERPCAWPGRLELDLDLTGGRFAQRWRLHARSWVPLPGAPDQWPEQVRVGDTPLAVVEHEGAPAVRLAAGEHAISGRFHWRRMPDGLAIPPATGLIDLRLNGEPIRFPRFERTGRLWLGVGAGTEVGAAAATERDALGLLVYRRIEDDNPLRVITRLDLDVAGRAREIILDSVLLQGGIPLGLNSPLPARLEADGRLRLQIRPGHWELTVTAHHPGPVTKLDLSAASPPWPRSEVWVFAAYPQLRQVEPTGAEPVDPRQTRLPAPWARLPAYLMRPGGSLRLVQVRRGDADPAPDRLSLERDLWLDFGGGGYTLRDHIRGELTRSWRLQVGDALALGQVLVAGEPRFITRLPGSPQAGVEVRQGRIDLVADSRIEEGTSSLPATGWRLDFQSLRTRLHLPPGWDLLAVAGIDNLPDSWLNRWTLLDLFLVLIIALAVARLWSWPWGVLALAAMVLIWQEPDAPRMIWLNLLAVAALLRLLPAEPGRAAMAHLRRFLLFYQRGSLVLLAVIAVPFLVEEMRTGIYPQLERPWTPPAQMSTAMAPTLMEESAGSMRADSEMVLDQTIAGEKQESRMLAKALPKRKVATPVPKPLSQSLPSIDPDTRVQTGPGVPTWRWKTLELTWNGPVPQDHRIHLWLLTPGSNLALALARLALVLVLGLKIAGLWGVALRRAPAAAAVLLVAGLSGMPTLASAQQFPSPELLEALKTRLLEPPDCHPACADIPHLRLQATGDTLELVMTVDADAAVALPIPGGTGVWTPTAVTLDGKPYDGLRRGKAGPLLVAVQPGRWSLGLTGPLPPRAQIELPLPLHPRRVEVMADGWRVEGIDDEGRPGAQIRLVRLRREGQASVLQPTELPPLVLVRRTLRLGVDWRVQTRVERRSVPEAPIVLEVPLIPGEQVLREEAQVHAGRLLVSLAPGQRESAWSSSLEPVDKIRLRASEDPRLSEEWRVDLSPLWHLTAEGIPMIHHQGRLGRWLPTWRPWPGETLSLTLSRPEGVPGPTLTLDESDYQVRPGQRVTEAALALTLRSSRGGRHRILLPPGAELQQVAVDGLERPLRPEGRGLSLPLVPGTQRIRIQWRQPDALASYYSPPVPDLKTHGVNASTRIQLGQDRWVLLTGGPDLGPAVLFWGLVVVLVFLAVGLGRSRLTPLKTRDWLLLGLGLSQAGIWVGLLVTGWLFALGLRARLDRELPPWRFNLMQTGLFLFSLAALSALVVALQQGLLGQPEMQIAGNGSTSTDLNWYQDRSDPELPRVWVISVPILVYRGLMLAWALWLAHRLLGWLRWGWQGLSSPMLWRDVKLVLPRRKRP
ncbi:hypothetical protein [Candidatus Thiosymbion oneisti]|uniref:hypothetical protein n=1 Tax=Candidatus Thiosymbion oneisti TaxID=589554 RepID=UPI000AD2546E|nr:hypothetical protein [Candidatus Thiosymbion oneisti]